MEERRKQVAAEVVDQVARSIKAGRDFTTSPADEEKMVVLGRSLVTRTVVWRGSPYRITVGDTGFRPPHPDGVWIDDLLSAACRNVFGCDRGTARPVQGTANYEFREWWEQPTLYKIVTDVAVSIVKYGREIRREKAKVNVTASPGAVDESVIFASVYQLCERNFGMGGLEWTGSSLRYVVGSAPVQSLAMCRYTIVRGGTQSELIIQIPLAASRQWDAIRRVVESECKRIHGPGNLSYAPHLGETFFEWKQ